LKGGLIGGRAEVCQQVANLLLTGVDDLTGRSLVDGGSHILAQLLEAAAQLIHKGPRRQKRFHCHELLLRARQSGNAPSLLRRAFLSA
jgi:hypothetical protein